MQSGEWRAALTRTRRSAFGRLATLLGATELTSEFWRELEATLIQADLGVQLASEMLAELRRLAASQGLTRGQDLRHHVRQALLRQLSTAPRAPVEAKPLVQLVVGVNGSGKTTAAARLAYRWQARGKRVMLAAADTYRAAAGEQLASWAKRLGLEVITGQPGSDPGAVVYDACQASLARGVDVLIADTSGRMHTSHNLMAELQKIHRVAAKVVADAPHDVYLVLDATTGQNALSQAKAFAQAAGVTGVILAKLDTSARGGVAVAVVRELGLPIEFVGLGEGPTDLSPFDAEAFVDGLLESYA